MGAMIAPRLEANQLRFASDTTEPLCTRISKEPTTEPRRRHQAAIVQLRSKSRLLGLAGWQRSAEVHDHVPPPDRTEAVPPENGGVAEAGERFTEVDRVRRARDHRRSGDVGNACRRLDSELLGNSEIKRHERHEDPGPLLMRVVHSGRSSERDVSILTHEPRAELQAAACDAVRQYTPPPGQVWVGAAASRHLRGCWNGRQPDGSERNHAHHPLEYHQTPIQLADSANARRLERTTTDLFIHPPSRREGRLSANYCTPNDGMTSHRRALLAARRCRKCMVISAAAVASWLAARCSITTPRTTARTHPHTRCVSNYD